MNSSPVVISYLTRFYWENRCLQILSNTVALNSYLGLSVLSIKKKFVCIKQGERVNEGTKRMNSLPLSPLFIYLTRFYWENRCLQILRHTVALNSYLGFSALSKKTLLVCIKFNKGGNSLPKNFERTANIRPNL